MAATYHFPRIDELEEVLIGGVRHRAKVIISRSDMYIANGFVPLIGMRVEVREEYGVICQIDQKSGYTRIGWRRKGLL